MGRGERLQLSDQLPVPAAGKPRFHPRFQRGQARLLEPACLRSRERRGVHAGERGPAPPAQRLLQPLKRASGVPGRQRGIPLGRERLEPQGVHFLSGDTQ
jgi:hypothetical protein